jgi:hypothetical protein
VTAVSFYNAAGTGGKPLAPIDDSNITEQVDSRLDDLFGDDEAAGPVDAPTGAPQPRKETRSSETAAPFPASALAAESGLPSQEAPAGADFKIDAEEIENSPIKDLKSVILSLEWEITDPVMAKLEEEIRKLETIAQDDKIVLAYLRLLASLGNYIRKNLARAHVDAITLLHAVYDSLERAMLSKDISDGIKKKMLFAHVNQYKKLKMEIQSARKSGRRTASSAPPPAAVPAPSASAGTPPATALARGNSSDAGDITHISQEILYEMRTIQKTIQQEFAMLREEIQRLRRDSK